MFIFPSSNEEAEISLQGLQGNCIAHEVDRSSWMIGLIQAVYPVDQARFFLWRR